MPLVSLRVLSSVVHLRQLRLEGTPTWWPRPPLAPTWQLEEVSVHCILTLVPYQQDGWKIEEPHGTVDWPLCLSEHWHLLPSTAGRHCLRMILRECQHGAGIMISEQ